MNPTRITMLGLALSFFLLGSVSGFAAGQRGEPAMEVPALGPDAGTLVEKPLEPGKDRGEGFGRDSGIGMDMAMRALGKRLSLSPEQEKKVREAIEKSRKVCGAILDETRPRFEAAREEMEQTIRGVLTAEQASRYEELLRQRRPRGSMRWGGGHRERGRRFRGERPGSGNSTNSTNSTHGNDGETTESAPQEERQ